MIYIIYGKDNCPHCERAKNILESKGLEYDYKKLGEDYTKAQLLDLFPTAKTVPQILKVEGNDITFIGGADQLQESF